MDKLRYCSKCVEWKTLDQFYIYESPRQVHYVCKACQSRRSKRWNLKHGHQLAERYQAYYREKRDQGFRRVDNRWEDE